MSHINQTDILIVGSGPAGMSTALNLVKVDPGWANRLVVLDKAVHPREKLCGGGLTPLVDEALARVGLTLEVSHVSVQELVMRYQNREMVFRGDPVLRVVHRQAFDHWLVRSGFGRGVRLHQGEAVESVRPRADYVEVITDQATLHARTVVAADGSPSFVRRSLNWDAGTRISRLLDVVTPETRTAGAEGTSALFDFTPTKVGCGDGSSWRRRGPHARSAPVALGLWPDARGGL
jgi:flavin-dependent dehydrogenase